jgi:acyl carrier protein
MVEEKLKRYIMAELMFEQDGVSSSLQYDESLLKRGIIDSMGFIQLIQFIEEEFNIKVENEEMIPENFETISGIARFIRDKQVV